MASLVGTPGNDTLTGDNPFFGVGGNDIIRGIGGDDVLNGRGGSNSIDGGDGNDVIRSSGTTSTLRGGVGDDSISSTDASVSIAGGDGVDRINVSQADALVGLGGFIRVDAGAGDDVVNIAQGDALAALGGTISVNGGDGNDDLNVTLGNSAVGLGTVTINGGDGDDSVAIRPGSGLVEIEGIRLVGGAGIDEIDLSAFENNPLIEINIDTTSEDPVTGAKSGTITILSVAGGSAVELTTISFADFEIVCFTPGTLITTEGGEVPVEELRAGDLVLTRDHGLQPLRWIGQREMSSAELAAAPQFAPVRIAAGALGGGQPERDLIVSPQHRVLLTGALTQLHFAEAEVLVAAKHLIGRPGIERLPAEDVTYIHVMCERHEVIRSNGAWTESFQPGAYSLQGIGAEQRAEILTLFPELATEEGRRSYAPARYTVKPAEAQVLLSA